MTYTIKGKTGEWELTIGLEIHAQVATKSKLFSRSSTEFGAEPNTHVSFVDAAMPGMLPVINEFAVEQAVKTGLGINAKINLKSQFDRKNYFYADLPQGYQITQLYYPIVGEGHIEINLADGSKKRVGIERIHLEQDAGKLMHDQHPNKSFVDLNRCGIALMEIVSKPDMNTPDEAVEYVKKLRSIVRTLGTCDADMEKGQLRCDANVSVRIVGEKELGTRCEIKNLNSTRNIARAIIYEAERQVELIEKGEVIHQQTRLFDADFGETRTMRSKEDAMDYRYFPEPDLPPLVITQEFVESIRKTLPELPEAKKERYMSAFGITEYDAGVISSDTDIASYFEKVLEKHEPKMALTWLSVELFGRLNKLGIEFDDCTITADKMIGLLDLIANDTISGKIAKDVMDIMLETGDDAEKIVEEKGLKQVTDVGAIEKVVDEVIAANGNKVTAYQGGQERLFGFFVGQVMKLSGGKANPGVVNELLKKKIG